MPWECDDVSLHDVAGAEACACAHARVTRGRARARGRGPPGASERRGLTGAAAAQESASSARSCEAELGELALSASAALRNVGRCALWALIVWELLAQSALSALVVALSPLLRGMSTSSAAPRPGRARPASALSRRQSPASCEMRMQASDRRLVLCAPSPVSPASALRCACSHQRVSGPPAAGAIDRFGTVTQAAWSPWVLLKAIPGISAALPLRANPKLRAQLAEHSLLYRLFQYLL